MSSRKHTPPLAPQTKSTGISRHLPKPAPKGELELMPRMDALEKAIALHGKPEIFNTDQVSQFTSEAFTSVLRREQIKISMDEKDYWRDNVFVERSIKYEEVYRHAYRMIAKAKRDMARHIDLYNIWRPHTKLDRQTPSELYRNRPRKIMLAT